MACLCSLINEIIWDTSGSTIFKSITCHHHQPELIVILDNLDLISGKIPPFLKFSYLKRQIKILKYQLLRDREVPFLIVFIPT